MVCQSDSDSRAGICGAGCTWIFFTASSRLILGCEWALCMGWDARAGEEGRCLTSLVDEEGDWVMRHLTRLVTVLHVWILQAYWTADLLARLRYFRVKSRMSIVTLVVMLLNRS